MRLLGLFFFVATCWDTACGQPPAEFLDLSAWKLTLPYNTPRAGNPDEVLQPELARFSDPSCFHLSPEGDCVLFRAACGGLGTTNSSYPRSELREMQSDGADESGWSTRDGVHELLLQLAIRATPEKKQHVVCVQIHDANEDVLMLRLEKRKLFIERGSAGDVAVDGNYELGKPFEFQLRVEQDHIRAWYNGHACMDWQVARQGCYFKAGCYTQSNVAKGDRPEAFGEVAIYRLQLKHSP